MGEAGRRGLQAAGLLWDDAVKAALISFTQPLGSDQSSGPRRPGQWREVLALLK